MKSQLARQVRKLFSEGIRKRFPLFRELSINETKGIIPSGDRLYLRSHSEDMEFYLLLCIASEKMGDAFTIECAYTNKKRFPASVPIMYPVSAHQSDPNISFPQDGDMRFRIGELFDDHKDYWWWITPPPRYENLSLRPLLGQNGNEEPNEIIAKAIADALDKIEKYVNPYFMSIIRDYDNNPNYWRQFSTEDIHAYKNRLIHNYGGEIESKCAWKECNNRRLKKVVYCVEHLPEYMKRTQSQ